ncbi:hydroxyacid dehydrogenase [Gryllotalpicola koreensis]|uniref:Hydroxyacid dehydrogenase n=1 Tax=Gryllotalpicola koreensis TaxID=993086 RepID=A0ABP7ZZI4_9MICO
MTESTPPVVLAAMSRATFENQYGGPRLARLRTLAFLDDPVVVDDLDDPALTERLARVEVLLTGWGAPLLTAERLERMPRLRALIHSAGSIRPFVTEEFWRRGILASTVADANAIPVAEFTLAAVIMAGKRAPFLAAQLRADPESWGASTRFGELGNRGRTIGVVGFSRIGRRVVTALQQLEETTVLVADPYADPAEVQAAGGRLVTLDELLPAVDVLSLHAPALPETAKMIGAAQLAALPDHTTVINTARGSLVDTAALERECASGRLNAILDVTEPEPLPAASVLHTLPNVFLTPHVAGSLGNELSRMADAALDELERYAQGSPLAFTVSSEAFEVSA